MFYKTIGVLHFIIVPGDIDFFFISLAASCVLKSDIMKAIHLSLRGTTIIFNSYFV